MASKHNKTPADIRRTFKRHRLPLPWAARIDDCLRLCAGWHNRFGACLTLDNERLRALCRRLVDDQFSVDDCVWAVEAYHQHCQTDRWHIDHPAARKTLAQFFADDRFEEWVERGRRLKAEGGRRNRARSAETARKRTELQVARAQEDRSRRIRDWFASQSPDRRAELLAQAWGRLTPFMRRALRRPSIDQLSTRAEIGKLMDEQVGPPAPPAFQKRDREGAAGSQISNLKSQIGGPL